MTVRSAYRRKMTLFSAGVDIPNGFVLKWDVASQKPLLSPFSFRVTINDGIAYTAVIPVFDDAVSGTHFHLVVHAALPLWLLPPTMQTKVSDISLGMLSDWRETHRFFYQQRNM